MNVLAFTSDDWWTMGTAIVCALACAIPGCFLVLRRMSLLGDALSHSILPGLALAFMFSGSRSLLPMLIGALVAGLCTALFASVIEKWGRVPEDSALGVVFTSLFALGVVLMSISARNVDLDPSCVLYGSLEYASFDRVQILGMDVPRVMIGLLVALAVNLLLLKLFFKELTLVSFDSILAKTLGFAPTIITTGFLMVVSLTVVASFEAVGSILVVTMLVAPAATAHLLTDRLLIMLLLSAGVAIVSAALGYIGAVVLNTSVAGMISVVACSCYLLALCAAPRYGIIGRAYRRIAFLLRVIREDLIGVMFRAEERRNAESKFSPNALQEILSFHNSRLLIRLGLLQLRQRGLIARSGNNYALTSLGRSEAGAVVRGHRLWESYLDRFLNLPLDHLHEASHRIEHYLSPSIRSDLEAQVRATHDPHGTPIPEEKK